MIGKFASAGFTRQVDIRPARFRVKTLEDVLLYVRHAFYKVDLPVGSLEEPKITVACDVDQALHGSTVALIIHKYRRRDLIPVPGIVRMILVVALDLSRRNVDGYSRRRIKVVARTLIPHPWSTVS